MKYSKFIQISVLKMLKKTKKIPAKVFFVKNKKEEKILNSLKDVAKFFGYKRATIASYNCYNKNSLGDGKFFYSIDALSILDQVINKLEKE